MPADSLLLAAALALGLVLPGTESHSPGAQEGPRCRHCDSTGREPCPEHPEEDAPLEDDVLYCSVVASCAICSGAGFVDCERCENAAAGDALEARRALSRTRGEALEELGAKMGRPLRLAESEHFVLVWEMIGMKVEKRRRTEHQMLHLTLERLERQWLDYVAIFDVDPGELPEKPQVFVWHLQEDHDRGALVYTGMSGPGGIKLMGALPRYSVCGNRGWFRTDEHLHRNLVHSLSHLLFSHQRPSQWIGNKRGGWADEGLAHWFEDRYFGLCDNYCYEEVDSNRDFKSGRFKFGLRKLVAAETAPPLAGLMSKNTDALTLEEHALALGVVDYLIDQDAARFDELGVRLRTGQPAREVLRDVYGTSILELEPRLHEWVLETYPKR